LLKVWLFPDKGWGKCGDSSCQGFFRRILFLRRILFFRILCYHAGAPEAPGEGRKHRAAPTMILK
jgi:hypothetical protein